MKNEQVTIDLSSMDKTMESILIKERDLTDKTPMEYLKYLCQNEKNSKHFSKERMLKIISQRILALEDAGIVYIETDDDGCNDELYSHTIEEIELLKNILQNNK